MSLREEIVPYTDGNCLIAPCKVVPGTRRASDNGPMFTAEYYLLLLSNGEYQLGDIPELYFRISRCMSNGILCREPGDDGQEGPDDYLGVLAACRTFGIESIPKQILDSMIWNWGFLNNECPGTFKKKDGRINWEAFLVRQPQLIAAALAAADVVRWYHFPLFLYSALVIAVAGLGRPQSDTDARRLSWLLIQAVCNHSLMCRLAFKIWKRRLYHDYGADGMRAVAALYYRDNHPFIRYHQTIEQMHG